MCPKLFFFFRFRFAGRVIGFAIIQGHLLDVFFAPHFYKALLNMLESLPQRYACSVHFSTFTDHFP